MEDTITIIVGILVIAVSWYIAWSTYSLKKLLKANLAKKLEDKYILESIVHTRTSLNVVYASITIMTFVLTFMGVKAVKDITDSATQATIERIQKETPINIEEWKANVAEASSLLDDLRNKFSATRHVVGSIDAFLDTVSRKNQRLFVVNDIRVSKGKLKYQFSDLKTIDGLRIPIFKSTPVVSWIVRSLDGDPITGGGVSEATASTIEFSDYGAPVKVDLWIYGIRR